MADRLRDVRSRAAAAGPRVADPARAGSYPGWKRNLAAITAAVFIGFTGFTLVMPFLPLYLEQLGVRDVGEIAFWAGISLGITPAVTALLSPFWGRLADRFGRKLMVCRSLGSFVLVMTAMAYVTEPWHVFTLRLVQGFFAGYGPLSLTMAADASPPDRLASSIGLVQTAQRLGPALGPVLGGAVAQLAGLRNAFFVSAAFYLFGFVVVLVFYREPRLRSRAEGSDVDPRGAGDGGRQGGGPEGGTAPTRVTGPVTFRNVLAFENFLLLMGVIFGLQFVDRSLGPILPLHLAAIGVPVSRVPVVSGLMFSLTAGGGALGNTSCAVLLRRYTARAVIGASGAIAAAAVLVFVLVPVSAALYVAAFVFGLAIGGAMTAAYTAGGSVMPPDARGTGFGFLTSASLAGLAISPMVSGLVGALSIPAVFVFDAMVLAVLCLAVSRLMASRAMPETSPATEEL